jgi:hypothetical protein
MFLTTSFFQRLQTMEVDISLYDFDHFMDFETPMFDKWLDIMLVHTFA